MTHLQVHSTNDVRIAIVPYDAAVSKPLHCASTIIALSRWLNIRCTGGHLSFVAATSNISTKTTCGIKQLVHKPFWEANPSKTTILSEEGIGQVRL